MTEMEFADRLRMYRKAKNLTQQELADLLGVSNKSVSRWESGSYPDVAMLGPLANALGVTVDDLLGMNPPVKQLKPADWQNLLSFGFVLGGGVLFFLLSQAVPMVLCYGLYLAAMACGVWMQKNYTYHTRWFFVANGVMNLFVNSRLCLQVLSFFAALDGAYSVYAMTQASLTESLQFMAAPTQMFQTFVLLYGLSWGLAVVLTVVTHQIVKRYFNETKEKTLPAIGFARENCSVGKLLPAISPILLAGYLFLFNGETAILPGVFYVKQTQFFFLLWGGLTVLLGLELCLTRRRGMLAPFGVMQAAALMLPGMLIYGRSYGLGSGNLYAGTAYNPGGYVAFGQATWTVALWAVILAVLYAAACFVGIERKKTEESTAIGDL